MGVQQQSLPAVQGNEHRHVLSAVQRVVAAELREQSPPRATTSEWCGGRYEWPEVSRSNENRPKLTEGRVDVGSTRQGTGRDMADDRIPDDALEAFDARPRALCASNRPLAARNDQSQGMEVDQHRVKNRATPAPDVGGAYVVRVRQHAIKDARRTD